MSIIRSWKRITTIGLAISFLAGVFVAWYARFVHPFRPRVRHVVVQLPRKHAHLAGLTIGFVADTHVGPHFSAADVAPSTRLLRSAKPDILLFGGDLICESPRFADDGARAIADMVPTARYGAYGVLGNHDLSNGRQRVTEPLECAGVQMLANEAVRVETDRGDLWIAGIDDAIVDKPDLDETFRDIPADAPVVALWHEPGHADRVAPYGPFLLLSGHTHGGQIRIPGVGALAVPILSDPYVQGRYTIGDMTLFVSHGIGMYRPPVRLNCPPEVVIVTLME